MEQQPHHKDSSSGTSDKWQPLPQLWPTSSHGPTLALVEEEGVNWTPSSTPSIFSHSLYRSLSLKFLFISRSAFSGLLVHLALSSLSISFSPSFSLSFCLMRKAENMVPVFPSIVCVSVVDEFCCFRPSTGVWRKISLITKQGFIACFANIRGISHKGASYCTWEYLPMQHGQAEFLPLLSALPELDWFNCAAAIVYTADAGHIDTELWHSSFWQPLL